MGRSVGCMAEKDCRLKVGRGGGMKGGTANFRLRWVGEEREWMGGGIPNSRLGEGDVTKCGSG